MECDTFNLGCQFHGGLWFATVVPQFSFLNPLKTADRCNLVHNNSSLEIQVALD